MGMTKSIKHWWRRRHERHYLKSHLHLVLDISMLLLVIAMLGLLAYVFFYRPEIVNLPFWSHTDKTQVQGEKFDSGNLPLNISSSISKSDKGNYLMKIDYKNDFSQDLENVKISVSDEYGAKIDRFEIYGTDSIWKDAGNYIEADKISAGEQGSVSLYIWLSGASKEVRMKASSSYASGDQSASESFFTNPIVTPVDINLSAGAYYYTAQGDQLGIGPIPPMVGLPTSYWILFDLNASNGDAKDFALVADLPKGVEFTGNRTMLSGDMSYNSSAKQVVWKIGEVKEGDKINAGFEVKITPTSDQAGKVLPLVSKISYNALDSLSGEAVSGASGAIDTKLSNDSLAASDGKVIK